MNPLKPIFVILLSVFCSQASARLFLDVSILNKKGIDKGLTLGSELHSIEEVSRKEQITLKMRSGLTVILKAKFAESQKLKLEGKEYGPSSKIMVTGKILDGEKRVLKDFTKEPLFISLDESSKLIHSKDSQLVEVSIKPHLK